MRVDSAVQVRWQEEGLRFRGGAEGAPQGELDGDGVAAPSPVQTMLLALAGCTGADVVETLRKMRLQPEELVVRVEGERAAEPPRRLTGLRLIYETRGIPAEAEAKLRRAIALSQEKYCSVLHTFRDDLELSTEVILS